MFGARIVIADADAGFRQKLRETLVHAGYLVTGEVEDGRSALKVIFQTEPDLVIMDSRLPGSEGLEIVRIVEEYRFCAVILITASHDLALLEEAKASWVFAYLVKPLSDTQLLPAVEIALSNFKKLVKLEQENKRLKQVLEERKLIERAKGLVMEIKGFSEKEAYKYMQKISMDKCKSLASVARHIITQFDSKAT